MKTICAECQCVFDISDIVPMIKEEGKYWTEVTDVILVAPERLCCRACAEKLKAETPIVVPQFDIDAELKRLQEAVDDMNAQLDYDAAVANICERLKQANHYLIEVSNRHPEFGAFCLENIEAIEKVAVIALRRQEAILARSAAIRKETDR